MSWEISICIRTGNLHVHITLIASHIAYATLIFILFPFQNGSYIKTYLPNQNNFAHKWVYLIANSTWNCWTTFIELSEAVMCVIPSIEFTSVNLFKKIFLLAFTFQETYICACHWEKRFTLEVKIQWGRFHWNTKRNTYKKSNINKCDLNKCTKGKTNMRTDSDLTVLRQTYLSIVCYLSSHSMNRPHLRAKEMQKKEKRKAG